MNFTQPADNPPGGYTEVGDLIEMAADASDNVGVASVSFYFGTDLAGTDTTAPYTGTYDTTPWPDGQVTAIYARAVDAAGNMAEDIIYVRVVKGSSPPLPPPPPPPPSDALFTEDFEGGLSAWTTIFGQPQVVAFGGSNALLSSTAGGEVRIRRSFSPQSVSTSRMRIYWPSGTSDLPVLADIWVSSLHRGIHLQGDLVDGQWRIAIRDSNPGQTIALGPVLTKDVWHEFTITIDSRSTPWVVDWTMDGAPQPRGLASIPNLPVDRLDLGAWGWPGSFRFYHDDVSLSVPGSDPPPPPPGDWPASYLTGPLGQDNILPPRGKAFLIVWPNGGPIPDKRERVLSLETRLGRKLDGIGIHYGGGGTFGGQTPCAWIDTAARQEEWVYNHGAIPLVSWSVDTSPERIASGEFDPCLHAVADYFKQYPFKIMLRLMYEHNGTWMSWKGVGPTYVAAWRHYVDVFKSRGASNVGFWWTPQEGFDRAGTTASYPGDAYVDWVGSDNYNWCYVGEDCWVTPLHPGWAEWWELFNYKTSEINHHDEFGPRKPFVVGETNTVYDPSNPSKKGQWYRNIPAKAKEMQYLTGIQFFDVDVSGSEGEKARWPVDYPTSDPSVFEGFKAMALDPYFNP